MEYRKFSQEQLDKAKKCRSGSFFKCLYGFGVQESRQVLSMQTAQQSCCIC